MRRALVVAVAVSFACALGQGRADAASKPAWAGTCGLPNTTTQWMDFGWPAFSQIFGRPGVILSASSGDFGAQMRDTGAKTVYWDMYLNKRVGQPATPADPATIVDKANKLYDFAATQMGCTTPVIIENELFGAGLPTPWSQTNATYRQNVLTFLQQLRARGAYPMLLVNSVPYTAGDAGVWWQQVAQVSDLIRETYVPATILYPAGPIVASRLLRVAYRNAIQQLTSIAIPPERIGLIVTMSTTVGFGGRNKLQPAAAWFDVVKWQVLAMRAVAKETGISSLWSWGWGEWTAAEQDPDKTAAACVWLWARSQSLCDGPGMAGPDFDTSLTEGQIRLPAGAQCTVGKDRISNAAIGQLQAMTGDRDSAFTALYGRLVDSREIPVTAKQEAAAERAIVSEQFHGSWSQYGAALSQAHGSRAIALGVLGDELRRAQIEETLTGGSPGANAVATFYRSYPDLSVRFVKVSKPTSWLNGKKTGYALSQLAPDSIFSLPSGKKSMVHTPLGTYAVTPRGQAVELGLMPLAQVRPAIVAALKSFARGAAYERREVKRQQAVLSEAICAKDDLPQPGTIDLATYLPFLTIH